MTIEHPHFKDKEAIEHVAERRAQSVLEREEEHGVEAPGSLSQCTHSARESALLFLLIGIILQKFSIPFQLIINVLLFFSLGLLIWKTGRSALMGWAHLERLHRVLAQEKWEIDNRRDQEKSELTALYAAKGFSGKLLDEVISVLMSDGDRLLRVMAEEELGLSLEAYEHPLKQALGAFVGVFIAALFCFLTLFFLPTMLGLTVQGLVTVSASSLILANYVNNALIGAVVWNSAVAFFAAATVYLI